MVDVRQSIHYANYLKRIGWTVERIGEINYFLRKFPLIGSVLKVQRPEEINRDVIDKISRKYRVFQVIIEPKTELDAKYLVSIGFKLSQKPYLPSRTLQIDLTQSQKEIFRHFKKDSRSILLKALSGGGRGADIRQCLAPDEIVKWREAWKNSVNFKRYVPPAVQLLNLRKSFPGNYSLFLTSHNISGRIIGGVLFTRSLHDFAYYWYGFTNKEGRASLSQYSLLYQGILWAKKHGVKVFDFEGVYDPRFPDKSWLGFSHFKRSFGGYEVEYPGCYTKFRLAL